MTTAERERIVRDTVAFVLGHYEVGAIPFTLAPVDIDRWWSARTIVPHDPSELLEQSKLHYQARLARWTELAIAAEHRAA